MTTARHGGAAPTWATVGVLLVVKRPENSVGRYLLLISRTLGYAVVTGVVDRTFHPTKASVSLR